MPTYTITTVTPVDTHCGELNFVNEAKLSLTDQHVSTLLQILKKAYADGEDLYDLCLDDTDLIDLDIKLYDLIHDAYFDCSYHPYYENCVNRAYDRYDHIGILIDWDQVRRICMEGYGYIPEEAESTSLNHFHEWFDKNIIDTDRLLDFERKENLLDLNKEEFEFSSPAQIPTELIQEFLNSKR